MSPRNLERLRNTINKPYGIFFCCGPTGSGKTTTLHSILKELNTPDTKIWTARIRSKSRSAALRQVQVNRKAGLDFVAVMRAFLRADPDVIMVGEMRDKETVTIGIEASLTSCSPRCTPTARIRRAACSTWDGPIQLCRRCSACWPRLAKRLCKHCKRPTPTTTRWRP